MKIGIFGGTFDPVHNGHLAIAEEVRSALNLDRVLLIPSYRPPHKSKEVTPALHRLAMVRLAVEGHPGLEASDLEVVRRGKSYTIDTVRELEGRYPPQTPLHLIMGLDALLEFSSWREPKDLAERCDLVAVFRPGSRFIDLREAGLPCAPDPRALEELDAGRRSKYELPMTSRTQLILLRVATHEDSATKIRSVLSSGASLKNLLPAPVESYIMQNNLYGRETHSS
ncbi:MAG TPA: nicotinate-nucleotide adenylyltransferase [Nitrospiria bacterium]